MLPPGESLLPGETSSPAGLYFAWSEPEEKSGSDPEGEAFSAKVAFLKSWPKGCRKGVQMKFISGQRVSKTLDLMTNL